MEERYKACFLLHALGDTIGFKNGQWEFNYFRKPSEYDTLEILYEFIELGGINHLSIKGWMVSDDTIFHLAVADALLQKYESLNDLGKILKKMYIKVYYETPNMEKRFPGLTTSKNIKKLKNGVKWNEIPYDLMEGGSGASMRSLCIGLAFHGEKNRDVLITVAIESSRITHNSATGYLGGLTTALFTAYAIEGIHIYKWPNKLMELLETNKIESLLTQTERGIDYYLKHKDVFINKWKIYIDDKFIDGKPVKRKSSRNLVYRGKYYFNTFGFNTGSRQSQIGSGGDDSTIIAYDCLIDSMKNWEKLVIYSMLHFGDTDTTGCIAGGWYGALYGFTDVAPKMITDLEFYEKIKKYGINFYKKFYKK
jgi:ADP-ribosylarginine hydrolase